MKYTLTTQQKKEFFSMEYSDVQDYAQQCTEAEPAILQELARVTFEQAAMPSMISGHLQGRVLAMVSKMIRPKKILEIGTFTGYATICLAEGLTEGGTIHTIDRNERTEAIAKYYFGKAGLQGSVVYHSGEALTMLDGVGNNFDIAFIDADKKNYPNYYKAVLELLSPGGFMLFDNMLWHGKVLEQEKQKDKRTAAILKTTALMRNDLNIEFVFLPVRDGLTLIRKK